MMNERTTERKHLVGSECHHQLKARQAAKQRFSLCNCNECVFEFYEMLENINFMHDPVDGAG